MKTKLILFFSLIIIFILYHSCSMEKNLPTEFTNAIDDLKFKYAPDKRIALFDVEYNYEGNIPIINFETNILDAVEDIKSLAENLLEKDSYKLNISTLPSPQLGDSIYAIINVSVANIRKTPSHSAELIDQSVMGSVLKILKKNRGWYLVQTSYSYLGWMQSSSIMRCNKNKMDDWKNSKKVSIKSNYAQVLSDFKQNGYPLCDAVYSSQLKYEKTLGPWIKVSLPDDKQGYIEKKYSTIETNNTSEMIINFNELLLTAKSFLGIPYLWGGNSSKGFDCSGFSQTVYNSQGILLPRDANMQVNMGTEIIPDSLFSNVKKGDLIFFGPNKEKITHVAISLGGPVFIHSSGNVHINSFNRNDDNFNQHRFKTLRYIKRIVMR
jgi:gamma-D-glutamyl-L-lysine dipeptidyl-peptidase